MQSNLRLIFGKPRPYTTTRSCTQRTGPSRVQNKNTKNRAGIYNRADNNVWPDTSAELCVAGEMEQELLELLRKGRCPSRGTSGATPLTPRPASPLNRCWGKKFTKLKFVQLKRFSSFELVLSYPLGGHSTLQGDQTNRNPTRTYALWYHCCCVQSRTREKKYQEWWKEQYKYTRKNMSRHLRHRTPPWQWQCQNFKTSWKSTAIANK